MLNFIFGLAIGLILGVFCICLVQVGKRGRR